MGAPEHASPSGQTPQVVRFGKYHLVERLGRGGMAEVWKAKIVGPGGFQRTLVVKRILPHLAEDPHFVDMFMAEARLSARLNHANIVQVYELGDVSGEFFLAMEYVRGRDLVNVMRALILRGLPEPGFGAYVMRETARALAYAHALTDDAGKALRLIHRDVSPSNVMIGFDGAVKLLDFGIAKALAETSDTKTATGTLKGKFGYMSPEQVEGRPFDHRADLWALGVMLHEVLVGKRLFKGASDLETIAKVRDARVEPPSLSNPAVTPELDRICLKALAKDQEQRYQSGDDLASDLDAVIHPLKFGPERMRQMLRDLFPEEPSTSGMVQLPLEEPPPKSNLTSGLRPGGRGWLWPVALGGAVALGAAAWLLATGQLGGKPVAMVPPPPAAAVAPPPAPALPADVRVHVTTNPSGASVYLDGEKEPRGRTPIYLVLPRGAEARQLKLEASGHKTKTRSVTPERDLELELTLDPVAPAVVAEKSSSKKSRSRKSSSEKTTEKKSAAPDLKGGDLADPFR